MTSPISAEDDAAGFLLGGGAAGALMRALDWTASPLGPPGAWPQSLRSVVGLLLNSKFPMFAVWGDELGMVYNDAYAAILGSKHPAAMGARFRDVWAEIWPDISPLTEAALAGEATYREDLPLLMNRRGFDEQTWFTFSYSPVRDESGAVRGMFCACTETTPKILEDRRQAFRIQLDEALRAQSDPRGVMNAAVAALGRQLGANRVGYSEVQDDDETILFQSCYADGVEPLTGAYSLSQFGPDSIARQRGGVTETCADIAADPHQNPATWEAIDAASFVSVPLVREGRLLATLYVNFRTPHRWTTHEVALIEDVASRTWETVERARAEMERDRFFDLSVDLIAVVALRDGAWRRLNPAFGRVLGWATQDLMGTKAVALVHPEDRARFEQAMAPSREQTARGAIELRMRRRDGDYRWIAWTLAPYLAESLLFAVGRDITERRLAEEKLRAEEARQALLVRLLRGQRETDDPSAMMKAASEAVGRHLDANRAGFFEVQDDERLAFDESWTAPGVRALEGHWPARLLDAPYLDDIRAGRTLAIRDAAEAALTRDPRFSGLGARALIGAPIVRSERWRAGLFVAAPKTRDWTPDEIGLVRVVADQTWDAVERARAVAALRENEARLRDLNESLETRVAERTAERDLLATLVETTDVMIMVADSRHAILAINKACADEWERIYGVRPKPGDDVMSIVPRPDALSETVSAAWTRALAGEEFTTIQRLGDHARDQRHYEIKFAALRDRSGAQVGAYQFTTDVTERLREQSRFAEAQEALRQSQKLEAMGQLTGGVAHDFNNLLTPIIGSLDLLQRNGLGGEREQRLIDGALQSAERAKTLVQRLLAFARRQPLQPHAVQVGPLVAGMADLIASTSGPRIKLEMDIGAKTPSAHADANQLEMALLNLSVNARDAMPDGGRLTIGVAADEVTPGHRSNLSPGTYVRLSVSDTGAGMDEETLRRAIEPFFSTKGVGRGTGLGLSMVHGLAAQLGGALHIASRPRLGTRVDLWLPKSHDQPASHAEETPGAAPRARAVGTALLVDDEELVRVTTADMLSELGYDVVEAGSADDAKRRLQAGLHVDLLVTDHLMPGMTGAELARWAKHHDPKIAVLIVSGYAEAEGIAPDLPRLTKPFRQPDLAASIGALLEGRA
ncbi:PAS domain-containing protein [Alsobacter sp. KACC 23698]|uniref:histidine kinase n=1 Tax=Alsobacter sp. KACC 23698 TaxID=3149229 RepID=A0AAU7JLI4_9HYPH